MTENEQADMRTRMRIEESEMISRIRREQNKSTNKSIDCDSLIPEIIALAGLIACYLILFG